MQDPLIDVIDRKGEVLTQAPLSEVRKKKLFHRVSGLIVRNSEGKLLVYQRSMAADHPGKYAILCCTPLHAGETYVPAAARIVREQLRLKKVNIQAIFPFNYHGDDANISFGLFLLTYDETLNPNPAEVGEHFFASLEEIEQLMQEKDFLSSSREAFQRYKKGAR